MFKVILVAVSVGDPALAEQMLQALQNLQLDSTTKVILCHVLVPLDSDRDITADKPQLLTEESLYRSVEQELQSYQAKIPGSTGLEIVTGEPAAEIVRLSHIYQADLIMIGSRGLTGMKRILEGSVSSQVVETAQCSVLVVKSK